MNKRKLYVFNPEHDLALANGDENFDAPRSARAFGKDAACLPLWYAEKNSVILTHSLNEKWLHDMQTIFPQLADVSLDSQPDFSAIDEVHPWGFNPALCKFLLMQGVDSLFLPNKKKMANIRLLSHRKTAIEALQFLHDDNTLTAFLPSLPKLLSSDEVGSFALQHEEVVFKAPWSGSGKGLCWTTGKVSDNILGWCKNIAEKQGCVIGEQVYDKVQDFALEFKCFDGMVAFSGYSLFETESHGVYKSNDLMTDDAIFQKIISFINQDFFLKIKNRLSDFIEKHIAPFYSGYLGIDMFVYQQNNTYLLYPCVEINLRMTMGLVARLLYDKFVFQEAKGKFHVDYFSSSEELWADHCERQKMMPLQVEKGRIKQGYLSLSSIEKGMKYRVRVEI